jgi:hypothetical protein
MSTKNPNTHYIVRYKDGRPIEASPIPCPKEMAMKLAYDTEYEYSVYTYGILTIEAVELQGIPVSTMTMEEANKAAKTKH